MFYQRQIRGKDDQLATIAYKVSQCMECLKIGMPVCDICPVSATVLTLEDKGDIWLTSQIQMGWKLPGETIGGKLFHSETNVSRGKMYNSKFPVCCILERDSCCDTSFN